VAGGAQGVGGRGKQLGNAFRRFQPFVHYVAKLNKAVAARRVALRNVITNFGALTTELSRRDSDIRRFVTSSDAALGNFANEQEAIQEALIEFPATLRAAKSGLASSREFSEAADPALSDLIPQAQALQPAFDATETMFAETAAPIRDQIRPFTRQIRPVLTHANEGSSALNKTVRNFGNGLGGFNSFLNTLAFKPKGQESYLFYLPWLNHNFNATFNLQDAGGPLLRGMVLLTCTGSDLARGVVDTANLYYLETLIAAANIPRPNQIPGLSSTGTCEYKEK